MFLKKLLWLTASLVFGAALASANITYTCDPSISASTCNYLNTTIAGMYNSTFTDANANIYITLGTTGLGESQTAFNVVSYSDYVAASPPTRARTPFRFPRCPR